MEKAVQTVKNIISKSLESGTDPYLGLLAYRSTPLDNQKSPAELLMARTLRTDLPVLETQLEVKNSEQVVDWKIQKKQKQIFYHNKKAKPLEPLQTGQVVRVYNMKKQNWGDKVIVKEMVAPRSYIIETAEGVRYRRNRKQLLKIGKLPNESNFDKLMNKELNS